MSHAFARMIGLAFAALVAAVPAHAEQWTAERVHSATMNADRNAHLQSERHGVNVGAASAGVLQTGGRRTRIEHTALDREANELGNRTIR
jgi:hypothetical protein